LGRFLADQRFIGQIHHRTKSYARILSNTHESAIFQSVWVIVKSVWAIVSSVCAIVKNFWAIFFTKSHQVALLPSFSSATFSCILTNRLPRWIVNDSYYESY
jgi:hypothetical protein